MTTDSDEHRRRSEILKAAQDRKAARATGEKGLLVVHTGPGKGKTTAALGMGLRAVGHGMRLGVVQFLKGAMPTAEREILGNFPGVEWHTIGDGFTWNTQDRQADIATARRAWEQAARMVVDPSYGMVILDELCVILAKEYLPLDDVLAALAARPPLQHVVLTGRGAPEGLVEAADLVSRIEVVKHPFRAGIKAQAGVEF